MSTSTQTQSIWRALLNRRMLICVFTGFSSGLPLYVLITLVPAWLRKEGVDLADIGLFALIGIPYTWKFIWAPAMDRYMPFPLGRRRSWMLLTHLSLLIAIACMGQLDPALSIGTIAVLAAVIAFFSASLDIVVDAFRREILPDHELGLGNSIHVNAYRISGLIPGSLALILADHLDWSSVYFWVAVFMIPGIIMTLLVKESSLLDDTPRSLKSAVIDPFKEFFNRLGRLKALEILAFMFLYKLGDSMATALATPFYIDMGFELTEIGIIAKNAALWPSIIGGILGGLLMVKTGINKALWLFGLVQIATIMGFVWLAEVGNNLAVLAIVLAMEYLGVGLGTTAFVAFIAQTTNRKYTATQLALFTALAALPRTFANALTGFLVEGVKAEDHPATHAFFSMLGLPESGLGWTHFYVLCTISALPGMLLLFRIAPWSEKSKQGT
ncbi:MAG: AmpG family muropeptide MFS transporter [Gammaproteobacteria bacterium]|nr:MAG: AmpG family muropeptide MFS transporter [Gammaproteobacteria bacterium]